MERLNVISYVGGKHYLLRDLYENFDYDKTSFIDLFGGSAKVILNLPRRYKTLIYNDIDNDIVNLFLQIKNNAEKLAEALDLPFSRIIFNEYLAKYKKRDFKDDLERAAITFYLHNTSFAGNKDSFALGFNKDMAGGFANKVQKLTKIKEKLKEIHIENRDYKELIHAIIDNEDIMLYCDPPYVGKEKYYQHAEFNHEELAELVNKLKCSVMLSYYPFSGIEELYPPGRWHYKKITALVWSHNSKQLSLENRETREEVLIMNYQKKNSQLLIL